MYRSLMFKSNPLTEQFHRGDGQTIRSLQIKNYSFTKIDSKDCKKNIQNHNRFSSSNKPRYLANNPQHKKQSILTNISQLKNHKIQLNSQRQPVSFDSELKTLENDAKIKFINTRRRLLRDQIQTPSTNRTINGKSSQNKQFSFTSFQNQRFCQKQSQIHSPNQIHKTKNSSLKSQFHIKETSKPIEINSKELFKNNEQQKNNHLKSTLYQSINLDHLFQKISSKVNQSQKQKKQAQSQINIDTLFTNTKKQSKTPNLKSRSPFDQFNLKFLLNKKKNFSLENQNVIKGSNMPYFQSFTSRQQTTQSKASKRSQSRSPMQEQYYPQQVKQSWGVSRRKKSAHMVIDDKGVIHKDGQKDSDGNSQENNLKMSLKISNLRHMLKSQQLEFK